MLVVMLVSCGGRGNPDPETIAKICNKHQAQIDKLNRLIDRHGEQVLERIKQRAPQRIVFVIEECLGRGDGQQPDVPDIQPTPVNQTTPTSTFESTKFLYTGENPAQTGVDTETIKFRRASVIRGKVINQAGEPVSGATVKILNRPEFGQTASRADGRFDMAVNGGGPLTVAISHSDFLSAQRPVHVPWHDYVTLDDPVVLTELDTAVTTVDLTEPQTIQVHRATAESDVDGRRRGTLMFEPGTEAVIENSATGETQTISSMDVRATEYTVGENGPDAMPAPLPPTSAYTYAAELSTSQTMDENTDGDSVFQSVKFNQPVSFYLENFLDVPVGTPVPVGVLDRAEGNWVPRRNGHVLKIMSEINGLAQVDVTGDGNADPPGPAGPLESFEIDQAELQQLATLYDTGQELWRVPMRSFSPVDLNLPAGPPESARKPDNPRCSQKGGDPEDSDCNSSGSIIDIHNQSLGEQVNLVGVPYSLHYKSSRIRGYKAGRSLDIPLTGSSIPSSLKRIRLEVRVAGQVDTQVFEPQTNLRTVFEWDGRDVYGRKLQGRRKATIRIGYVYNLLYMAPSTDRQRRLIRQASFGIVSDNPDRILFTPDQGPRAETTLWQSYTKPIGVMESQQAQGIGGWGLGVHHTYDPGTRILFKGDGQRRSADNPSQARVINTIADGGTVPLGEAGTPTPITFENIQGLDVADDASIYLSVEADVDGSVRELILRLTPEGQLETIAGGKTTESSDTLPEDGDPADNVRFANDIHGLARSPDGRIFFVETGSTTTRRIWQIDGDNTLHPVAGGGDSFPREGLRASEATFSLPGDDRTIARSIDVDASGNIYFALHRSRDFGGVGRTIVYQITPDGRLHQLRTFRNSLSRETNPQVSLEVGDQGSLFLSIRPNTRDSFRRIVRLTSAGRIVPLTTIDSFQTDFAVPEGQDQLFFTAKNTLYDLTQDGTVRPLTFENPNPFAGRDRFVEGGPAKRAKLLGGLVDVGPSDDIYVTGFNKNFEGSVLRRVTSALPGVSGSSHMVPSESGDRVFVFSRQGRHRRTLDARTGKTLFDFQYNDQGLLTGVTDRDGQTTTIQRNSDGQATAIVSPFGPTTQLTTNSNGFLTAVTNPAGEARQMTYSDSGLLTAMTDPNGNQTTFSYNDNGRLVREEDPVGGFQEFHRTAFDTGIQVIRETALGRTNVFDVVDLPSGDQVRRNTGSNGLTVVKQRNQDATFPIQRPDGSTITLREGPDPRFGMQSPISEKQVVETPGGLTLSLTRESTAVRGDTFALVSSTDTASINGKSLVRRYDGSSQTITTTSPEGRTATTRLNQQGRVIEENRPGLVPTNYDYNQDGQLTAVSRGNRTTTRAYTSNGLLESVTDPLGHTTSYQYDAAGRVTTQTMPDGRQVNFQYDDNGNITAVVPPGRNAHVFRYTARNKQKDYEPPALPDGATVTTWTYNLDGDLTQISRPDMSTVDFAYDNAGRLDSVDFPSATYRYNYNPSTGNMTDLTTSNGVDLGWEFDGALTTQIRWNSVAMSGRLDFTYNDSFQVTEQSVNGNSIATFDYDRDGLVTRSGDMDINYRSNTELLTGTTLQDLSTQWTYNNFGEIIGRRTERSGQSVYETDLSRDTSGRIVGVTERVRGQTERNRAFQYNSVGNLVRVVTNGETVVHYEYDTNGNRVAREGPAGRVEATYDAQDRLTQYGDTTYSYNASGQLESKSGPGGSASYDYDAMGNLREVTLNADTTIEYLVDGQNRRVGKRVNGRFEQGFLYKDQINPLVELAPDGSVEARFVYGAKSNVPSYMIKDGTRYRIITDHLGSVRLVVNVATGNIVQRMKYDAFGRVILDTNPGFQPFGFGGGLYDPQTGLVRFGARDYDPTVGRWTAKDPLLFGGGSTNLYGYALNDPVNVQDLFGLEVEVCKRPLNAPLGDFLYNIDPYIPMNEWANWEFAHEQFFFNDELEGKEKSNLGFNKTDQGQKIQADIKHSKKDYDCQQTTISDEKARRIINRLKEDYEGTYNLLFNNCQHFAETVRELARNENGSPGGSSPKPDAPGHPRTRISPPESI